MKLLSLHNQYNWCCWPGDTRALGSSVQDIGGWLTMYDTLYLNEATDAIGDSLQLFLNVHDSTYAEYTSLYTGM